MGFIVFEEEAFNYLDAQLELFVKRMNGIREHSEWMSHIVSHLNQMVDDFERSVKNYRPTSSNILDMQNIENQRNKIR